MYFFENSLVIYLYLSIFGATCTTLAKMEFDLRALEINARARPPPDSQSTFRIETAAKLLPRLASEQELEVYLITFRKNELSPEHYRKRFRDIRKSDSENFADFAFKMQNFFKRWLQSIDSYDEIEQFLHTVSIELKIWLVDQKPKTVDEMARLADQYVSKQHQHNSNLLMHKSLLLTTVK